VDITFLVCTHKDAGKPLAAVVSLCEDCLKTLMAGILITTYKKTSEDSSAESPEKKASTPTSPARSSKSNPRGTRKRSAPTEPEA